MSPYIYAYVMLYNEKYFHAYYLILKKNSFPLCEIGGRTVQTATIF